jgi:hypothetical protein
MRKFGQNPIVTILAVLFVLMALIALDFTEPIASRADGPATVNLGTAANFSILAQTKVTDVPSSAIIGDVGLSPAAGSNIASLSCSEVTGKIYDVNGGYTGGLNSNTSCLMAGPGANKTLVDNAVGDMDVAFTQAYGATLPSVTTEVGAGTIGLATPDFTPGIYKWSTDVDITGDITLSGSASDIWIFQIAGDLVVDSKDSLLLGVKVQLTGGAKASNVFWAVAGSNFGAVIGTYATFNGTILSSRQVILQTGAVLNGRALADTQVVLDHNAVTIPSSITTLTVTKIVNNNHGGTKVYTDFPLFIDGGSVASAVASTTTAGLHTVSETSTSSYTSLIAGACAANGTVTLAPGDVKTCTITNTFIPAGTATLTVTKTVNNNHGGSKVVANFPLFIDGKNVTSGVSSTTSTGLHTVSETSDSGYTSVIGGACATNGTITLFPGEVKTCTITNSDIAPQLVVTKIVVGGPKVYTDFPLFIDGAAVVTGVASTTTSGLHTVSETSFPGYTAVIAGNCAADGKITLLPGNLRTCTITNTYTAPASSGGGSNYVAPVPPLIDVVKVPSPLALPAGPGPVTYTYTLGNIGTVPVSNVTMVDDTCSPITLISGDTNNNAKLDVNETWIYRCSTTLSATHTNTVTATGMANGISAVDIASATVVVGASVVPPLIHVTKIPKPLALPAGAAMVTYTEKITNPGTVVLSNVLLTDDKCAPMKYISGDINGDSKLDVNETWTYTCQMNLIKTTTNTAMASGEANGLTARDFAIATVVVVAVAGTAAVPALPNTGLPPGGKGIPWNVVVLSGIFAVSFLFYYYAIRKKRTA